MSTPSSSIGSRPAIARQPHLLPGGGRVESLVGVRAFEGNRVDPVAQLDADTVEALAFDVEVDGAVSAEVDLEPAEAVAQCHRLVVRAAGHDQRPPLDADRRRPFDELALAVVRLGAPQVAADPLGERAGELRVGELGDQQQAPAQRHGPAEQLIARRLVGEQPVAQRLRGHAGDLELDRVHLVVLARQVVEREHRLLPEATADLVGDRMQLVVGDVVDVEPARALERRRPLVGEEKTPSSSCEPRGDPPPRSTIRSTSCAKPVSLSRRRGSSGSVITAVLLVAKISASGSRSWAAADAGAASAAAASATIVGLSMRSRRHPAARYSTRPVRRSLAVTVAGTPRERATRAVRAHAPELLGAENHRARPRPRQRRLRRRRSRAAGRRRPPRRAGGAPARDDRRPRVDPDPQATVRRRGRGRPGLRTAARHGRCSAGLHLPAPRKSSDGSCATCTPPIRRRSPASSPPRRTNLARGSTTSTVPASSFACCTPRARHAHLAGSSPTPTSAPSTFSSSTGRLRASSTGPTPPSPTRRWTSHGFIATSGQGSSQELSPAYGPLPDTPRIEFFARCAALEDLAYGRATGRREYVANAERSLEWLFPRRP